VAGEAGLEDLVVAEIFILVLGSELDTRHGEVTYT
jgi:hypothetical protein